MTKTRVLAALVMGPLAIAAVLFLPTPWMMLLAALVVLAGLWEWFKLAGVEDSLTRSFLMAANLLLMVMLVWASSTAQGGGTLALFHIMMLLGVAWWWVALLWLRHHQWSAGNDGIGRAFKLVVGTLAVIPAWCALVVIHGNPADDVLIGPIPRNHLWLLTALMIVWMADTGAYFSGRKFGRRKLAPTISPNKTIEGLLGGLIAAVLVGVGFGMLAGAAGTQLGWVALAALLTAIASVIGDLVESLLKRQAGVKDSGAVIPGHGGVLDRIDSVLAALPVFALCKASFGF